MRYDESFDDFFLFNRERERELFGPKKRGPKPETFLLKVGESLEAHFSSFHLIFSHLYEAVGYN